MYIDKKSVATSETRGAIFGIYFGKMERKKHAKEGHLQKLKKVRTRNQWSGVTTLVREHRHTWTWICFRAKNSERTWYRPKTRFSRFLNPEISTRTIIPRSRLCTPKILHKEHGFADFSYSGKKNARTLFEKFHTLGRVHSSPTLKRLIGVTSIRGAGKILVLHRVNYYSR